MPDGYVKAIVMVSGSYVETERSKRMKSLRIRNKRTYAETILPNGDNVHQMIGLEAARVLQDLRRAFHVREAFRKCAKVWTHVRGKHELKGEVASFAAERLMHLMRPEPARPKLAFSFASAARWTDQLTGLLNDA